MISICSYVSDIGACRASNQDAVYVDYREQRGSIFAVGAVFDGIGGLECGELASEALAAAMRDWFLSVAAWIDIRTVDETILYAHFKDEAERLNEIVRKLIRNRNVNMGTTMSAVMVIRRHYYVLQVGDSRVYRWSRYFEQITEDDAIAKTVNGRIKKYLSNYMGQSDQLVFSEYSGVIEADSFFVFCTDGFYHRMRHSDLLPLQDIHSEGELKRFLQELVHTMVGRGESDNISAGVILLRNVIQ